MLCWLRQRTMSDEDDQTDELLALASIYDDSAFSSQRDSEGLSTGVLKASVEVPRPFHVKLAVDGECDCVVESVVEWHSTQLCRVASLLHTVIGFIKETHFYHQL